ncbi:hypothetical protein P152DRAFT_450335 [Eremomyces bilateralis CBS 781.70]|uniref:Nucleoporin Nup159/Nup146 N-terminal domain-containing protein n=1 Tax=Eremomyces bilateralis CBS 781.70 TaxID=1392243 RepID=A0A6G1FZS3_9PEZI|nr:uncharacterized protein P152DRAFT_450335 [Eremomyces bilateralis CBS 781.70]KAF1811170.1 hypothetical protein P152DRAFT_450335 [Eremomyces bilateralis CBS 781.70]
MAAAALGGGLPAPQANGGPDLDEVTTDNLGFQALNGETKIKLLPTPWPADKLPPPTSSLLSISAAKGLLAAASPEALIISSTETVRNAFTAEVQGVKQVKPFQPQATLPVPRISHVAFSANGSFLVICAEDGGGLAIYNVDSLSGGNKEPAFQISTNGVAVRALLPNPAPELEKYFAVVLTGAQVLLADLQEKQLVNGTAGNQVLHQNVSCVSWSNKGKQFVAGLADGTAVQLDPSGNPKALIPRPPQLESGHAVSQISWLANDSFLMIYAPTQFEADRAPDSTAYLVTRQKGTTNFAFQKLNEPCGPFGLNRSPPHHFISRLREWPPALSDLIIVSSTASQDVGLYTQSAKPLGPVVGEKSPEAVTNQYTFTSMANDSRRAQLPISFVDDMSDTSPIGMSLDLSSREKAHRPIPAEEEIEESPTPVPALMILNNEGSLSAWWIIYNDSIRESTAYPGLASAGTLKSSVSSQKTEQPTSPFGQVKPQGLAFGASTFTKPAAPAFGSPGGGAAFGGASTLGQKQSAWGTSTPAGSAFGGPAALGQKPSVWGGAAAGAPQTGGVAFGQSSFGSTPTFAKPAFGSPAPLGSTNTAGTSFGSVGGIGARSSPWGAASSQPAKPAGGEKPAPFGAFAASGNKATASPFATLPKDQTRGSDFGSGSALTATPSSAFGTPPLQSFASTVSINSTTGGSTIGTSSFGNTTTPQASGVFGQKQPEAPETKDADMDEDTMDDSAPQPAKEPLKPSGAFGGTGFSLGSTFKPSTDKEKESTGDEKTDQKAGSAYSSFGNALGDALKQPNLPVPETPLKKESGLDGLKPTDISTTSASPPKLPAAPTLFPSINKEPAKLPEAAPGLTTGQPSTSPFGKAQQTEVVEAAAKPLDDNDDEDLEEEPEVAPEDDAPLPPDPTTVARPSWFSQAPPGAKPTSSQDGTADKEGDHPKSKIPNIIPYEQPQLLQPTPAKSFLMPTAPSPPPPGDQHISSTTPAGLPKGPTFLPPYKAGQRSPRSPSPVRSASTPVSRPISVGVRQPSRPSSRTALSQTQTAAQEPQEIPDLAATALQRRPVTPPISSLQDEEAEETQRMLAAPTNQKLKLEKFTARKDYVGASETLASRDDIPSQIERLFRDINSMIDTLGLNARTLNEFIRGHEELLADDGREKEDLLDRDVDADFDAVLAGDIPQDVWVLSEVEDLNMLLNSMEQQLDEGRVTDPREKVRKAVQMKRDVVKLRHAVTGLRSVIESARDPAAKEARKSAPLELHQAAAQADLRAKFGGLQRKVVEAEDGIAVLRARIAQAEARAGGKSVPTVEAVAKTVEKMMRLWEERVADLDVLEVEVKKLRLRDGSRLDRSTGGLGERDGYSTPVRGRDEPSERGTPFITPRSRIDDGAMTSSVRSLRSMGSVRSSVRGRTFKLDYGRSYGNESLVQDVTREDVKRVEGLMRKRRVVQDTLKGLIAANGPKITEVGTKTYG